MEVNRVLLALLIFSFFAAAFSSHDCLMYTKIVSSGDDRKSRNRFTLVPYLTVWCVITAVFIARQSLQPSKKIALQTSYMKGSIFLDKIIHDSLNDCKNLKYDTTSEMDSKTRYAALYQMRGNTRQTAIVLPFSLETYFNDRQKNGNTEDLMKYEWARYETFANFPEDSRARPIRLAANGFYYCGSGVDDSVKCFSCRQVYKGFIENDIVSDVHSKISPNCPFLTGVDKSNVAIHSEEVGEAVASGGSTETEKHYKNEEYAQTPCQGPNARDDSHSSRRNYKFPDYENYQYRMDTFSSWPCPDMLEPSVLADAGYFYAGFGDCVRCFSCGGGLRNWEYGDGPWEEHERWFPHCLYLKQRLKERRMTSREAHKSVGDTRITNPELYSNENKTTKPEENETSHNNVFEENERLKDQLTCKICMDRPSNVVFIPCGHMISCETCAPHIRKCAICRKLIEGRVKAFMS